MRWKRKVYVYNCHFHYYLRSSPIVFGPTNSFIIFSTIQNFLCSFFFLSFFYFLNLLCKRCLDPAQKKQRFWARPQQHSEAIKTLSDREWHWPIAPLYLLLCCCCCVVVLRMLKPCMTNFSKRNLWAGKTHAWTRKAWEHTTFSRAVFSLAPFLQQWTLRWMPRWKESISVLEREIALDTFWHHPVFSFQSSVHTFLAESWFCEILNDFS